MEPLKHLVHKSMKRAGISTQIAAEQVVSTAEKALAQVFGMEVERLCKPLFLKNFTLTVTCTSASFAQELKLKEKEIVHIMNTELGYTAVDRIRYLL